MLPQKGSYQGTALAVPLQRKSATGFSPRGAPWPTTPWTS